MCDGCTDGTVSTCPQCPPPSIDPHMAHGHTLTAVAALHPVFSSPDTAAHVSEPEQWPETAEVGGAAAASSPYSILSGAPCGQIVPGLSVRLVLHTQEGSAVGR